MTTLRETLAKAIYAADGDTLSDYYDLADAVLRALATWEPSDAVVLSAMIGYHCAEADGVPLSCGMRVALRKALREMAEEGKP